MGMFNIHLSDWILRVRSISRAGVLSAFAQRTEKEDKEHSQFFNLLEPPVEGRFTFPTKFIRILIIFQYVTLGSHHSSSSLLITY